jgi:hypothetical protein
MVNYQDHRGSYKWHLGHPDTWRSPKLDRIPLKYIPMSLLTGFLLPKLVNALRYYINSLPYWQTRVIPIQRSLKTLSKLSFDTLILSNSKPFSSVKKSSVF